MSKLYLQDFLNILKLKDKIEIQKQMKKQIKRRHKIHEYYKKIFLPSLIFSKEDFDVIKVNKSKPNFITSKQVLGEIVFLKNSGDFPDISNKIVLIENADPGFDWIFTKNIEGLITKYGGAASHMAIRCAEFGLPAAIGCGEDLFNKLNNVQKINLNCKSKKIEIF